MRKFIKEELISVIGTLHKAHSKAKKLIEGRNFDALNILLTNCQETAIQVGIEIEKSEGEGLDVIQELERYCENLYQINEKSPESHNAIHEYKLLNKQLLRIENEIKNNILCKTEVVFFPFKSAMWDSMESVWSAAKQEPLCDVYVVPIPYYERNSDGTLAEMHYEGNDYPQYVPIMDWKQYRIEERRPDIAIIHNPYDGTNYVTSVEPEFYANNLRKYTNLLVYIPYFVAIYDVEEHLCVCSGTIFADIVIVQSELVRETYIREYKKFELENHCEGLIGDAQKKFLALGSPKFDKVLSLQKEKVEIPPDWEKLILKEDGTRKKVVFYNTTIVTLLTYREQMIAKISSVIEMFDKNKDMVLLWRPHPLSKSTLSSMRSDLLVMYNELVDKFCKDSQGIYDETSDMYLAIAISDAYYGDWSSVVPLYKMTGKPIMIQNVQIIND